jgi:hypothetical protein
MSNPVPAWILRPHVGRQLVERLGTECGVLYQLDWVDTVSRLRQGGDDAGGQGFGVAARRLIDRLRDDPLDGCDIDPRRRCKWTGNSACSQ